MTKRLSAALIAATAMAVGAGIANATTYYVATLANGGNDANDGLTWATAFATPKQALFVAHDGDKIVVGDGTWTNVGNCDMVVTNAVEFTSLNGPAATIFDGGAASSVGANYIYNGGGSTASTYRWVMEVRNADAFVHGFTMQGGFRYNPSPSASGLQLYNGTVSNCVIRLCRGGMDNTSSSGAGVYVANGLLKNCEIYGNVVRYNNNSTCYGGGVFQTGGTVDSCVITNNSAGRSGSGVFIRGGTLRNSLIADNHGHYSDARTLNTTGGSGGGLAMQEGGGLVENCVIRDNVRGLKSAAGVYVNNKNAILRNCVVFGNRAQSEIGGVLLAAGRVEHCTITGNSAVLTGTTGTGLRQTGGTAVNTIVWGNPTSGGASDAVRTAGTFQNNLVTTALDFFTAGDGNIAGNPVFTDAANGNFMPRFGSPAIDAGQTVAAVTTDFTGKERPQGFANDIGAYEYEDIGRLAVSFPTEPYTFLDGGTVTLTALINWTPSSDDFYQWFVDDVLVLGETGDTVTLSDFDYGRHTVKVVVYRETDWAEFELPDLVTVVPDTVYVSQSGSATFPYETPEKATASIKDAVDAVYATDEHQGQVVVAPSDATGYLVNAFVIPVVKNVRIESTDGPEATRIKCTNPATNDGRRAFELRHAGAVVSGFTIYNGNWSTGALGDSGSGAIQLYSGTVTNCVLRSIARGDRLGGAIRMWDGLVTHCVISNCYSRYNNDNTAKGGGIYMEGGTVAHCLIRDCRSGGDDNEVGGGIYIKGGAVRDSDITGCYTLSAGKSKMGGGIYMTGGTVERCAITNNCHNDKLVGLGGGVYLKGGTLRNCLVAGNRSSASGAGIYQAGGMVEFCTVTANTGTGGTSSGLFLNGSTAVCRYNILDGNGGGVASEPNCNIAYTAASSFATNLVVTASGTTYGTDNIYSAAGFVDAASRDWTLGSGSPAVDAALGADWVTDDLAGTLRPSDGNGDGTAAPDLGCYEAPDASAGPLRCSFSPDSVTGLGSVSAVFTASVSGTGADGELTYTWDFGAGATATAVGGDPAVQSVTFSGYGSRTVSLTVETQGGQTATYSIANCVNVGSSTIFVDATSENPVWPYATWETAAANVQDVFDSLITDGTTTIIVTVTNGNYTITEPFIVISYPIRLGSLNGPEVTTIRAASPNGDARSHFRLAHDRAFVTGFTFTGASLDSWNTRDSGASSLRITAGVVSNCVVSGAVTARSSGAVGVSGTGLLTHSSLRDCYAHRATSSGWVVYGGGVTVGGGGIVQFCTISGCHTHGADGSGGGGAYVTDGGILRDCEILNCYAYGTENGTVIGKGGSIRQTGGLVERCIVGDTVSEKRGGEAVRLTGGTMRNCLVRGAVAGTAAQALYTTGGSFVNCTVVTNGFGTAAASPVAASVAGGSVSNCVFAINNGGDVMRTSSTVAFSCFGEADGTNGNTARDPSFRNPAAGDYTLRPGSPCRNTGANAAFGALTDAVDLMGNPRLFGKHIDMGCYELQSGAGTMLLLQ